ncbi:hypothetical protein QWJ46_18035 [Rhizobium sp. CBN3]|uniref:hypothetical protein n=1 Tax=Rhizobium sp. CBN3 TaxID=3058045 RepID=UPI002672CE06|nr:hypothetical protein [Rhizobium sp. CBN3]MDO3434578.1 hypothetical protein [Rhizobium sp. CBN3]
MAAALISISADERGVEVLVFFGLMEAEPWGSFWAPVHELDEDGKTDGEALIE